MREREGESSAAGAGREGESRITGAGREGRGQLDGKAMGSGGARGVRPNEVVRILEQGNMYVLQYVTQLTKWEMAVDGQTPD